MPHTIKENLNRLPIGDLVELFTKYPTLRSTLKSTRLEDHLIEPLFIQLRKLKDIAIVSNKGKEKDMEAILAYLKSKRVSSSLHPLLSQLKADQIVKDNL